MKILTAHAFDGTRKKTVELLQEKLRQQYKDADIVMWKTAEPPTRVDIKKAAVDLFVDFNLWGFEQGTLAGSIAYNLLDCKQIHILLDDKISNEKQLEKQLSIAMFFYCADAQYCRYLAERYPDIPYLKKTEDWKRAEKEADIECNADVLCGIVEEVLRICHMVS